MRDRYWATLVRAGALNAQTVDSFAEWVIAMNCERSASDALTHCTPDVVETLAGKLLAADKAPLALAVLKTAIGVEAQLGRYWAALPDEQRKYIAEGSFAREWLPALWAVASDDERALMLEHVRSEIPRADIGAWLATLSPESVNAMSNRNRFLVCVASLAEWSLEIDHAMWAFALVGCREYHDSERWTPVVAAVRSPITPTQSRWLSLAMDMSPFKISFAQAYISAVCDADADDVLAGLRQSIWAKSAGRYGPASWSTNRAAAVAAFAGQQDVRKVAKMLAITPWMLRATVLGWVFPSMTTGLRDAITAQLVATGDDDDTAIAALDALSRAELVAVADVVFTKSSPAYGRATMHLARLLTLDELAALVPTMSVEVVNNVFDDRPDVQDQVLMGLFGGASTDTVLALADSWQGTWAELPAASNAVTR